MTEYKYIAAVLCLLLAGLLVWKEIGRQNKVQLAGRLIATLLAIAALYFLAVPLSYRNEKNMVSTNEAILLTTGADADSVAAFVKKMRNHLPVFTLDEKIAANHDFQATFVADPAEIAIKNYHALHVFGYGTNADQLEKQTIVFHPSPLPAGITSIYWPQHIYSGQTIQVQGVFHNSGSVAIKLVLLAYANTVDSVTVPANTDQLFQFTVLPKQLGRAVYRIAGIVKQDTILQEPVAIEVMPPAPLKLLLLASSPDFENKFLRNWLAEKGYAVASRTTTSANKTSKAYFNTPEVTIAHLTPPLLDSFDLIIADATELNGIGTGEQEYLRTAIKQGKGLIVKADSAASHPVFYATIFPLQHADTGLQHTTEPVLSAGSRVLQQLPVAPGYFIQPRYGTQPLIQDPQHRILANSGLYGAGRIVITTLPNTFSWILSGNRADYNIVWSALITAAVARKNEEESWGLSKQLPVTNEPVNLLANAGSAITDQVQLGGSDITLWPDPQLQYRWRGLYWPRNTGWQAGTQLNGLPYYWYAYSPDDWKTISFANSMRRMRDMRTAFGSGQEKTRNAAPREEIPSIIFFLVFLLSSAYLWFENKYFNA